LLVFHRIRTNVETLRCLWEMTSISNFDFEGIAWEFQTVTPKPAASLGLLG